MILISQKDRPSMPSSNPPVHPLKRGKLNRLKGPPRPASVDHLGLVEAVDRLRERIVKTVADAADRGLDARRSQALGVANRDILHPLSLWCTRPPPWTGRRACRACSSASSTKLACAVRLTRQPTMRRA